MTTISPDTSLALAKALQNDAASGKIDAAKKSGDLKRTEEASVEFEGVFVAEMLKPMFEGINAEAPFGGGKGEEIFRGMMVQEYGKIIARTRSIGLADSVKTEMIKMQEQADNANK